MVRRLCERANVTDAKTGAHTFRHTCALQSLKNGANIFDLKILLGHSKIKTTEIYLDAYNADMAIQQHAKFSPVDRMQ